MKKIFYSIFSVILFALFVNSCSEDNPVDNSGTVLYQQKAIDAFNYLNKVRANPESYSQSIGVNLSDVEARDALKWNNTLVKVAEEKAKDMATRNYFTHVNPDGKAINILISEAGYEINPDWYSDPTLNYFEALASGWGQVETGESFIDLLIVDDGIQDLGHRKHLLGIGDWNSTLYDCGIGYANNEDSDNKNYICIIIAKHE